MAASLVFPNVQTAPAQDGPSFEAVLGSVETEGEAEAEMDAPAETAQDKQKEETAAAPAPAPVPAPVPSLPFLLAVPVSMPCVMPEQAAAEPAPEGIGVEAVTQAPAPEAPEPGAPAQMKVEVPQQPQKPDAPAKIQVREVIASPETPEIPEAPEVPEAPEAPDTPEIVEKVEEPDEAQAPTPETPLVTAAPPQHSVRELPATPPPPAPAESTSVPTPVNPVPESPAPRTEVRPPEARRAEAMKSRQDHSSLRIPVAAEHAEAPPLKGEVAFTGHIEPKPDVKKDEEPASQFRAPEVRIEQVPTHTAAAVAEPVEAPAATRVSTPPAEPRPEMPVKPAPAAVRLEEVPEPKVIQKASPFRSVETLRVTVGGSGEPRAEVRITQRNGTIEMAVRTPHPELARDLRTALPELGSALDSQGFRSDIREVSTNRPETQDEGRRSNQQQQYYDEQQQRRPRRPAEKEEDDY